MILIKRWEALTIYGLGLVIGFAAGWAVRWAYTEDTSC